jgi:hypothetical protein
MVTTLSFDPNKTEAEIIKSILPLVKLTTKEQDSILNRARIFVKNIRK